MKTFKGLCLALLLHGCLAGNHFSFDPEEFDYELDEPTRSTCPPGQEPVQKPEGVICMTIPPSNPERNPNRIRFEEDEEIGK